MPLLFLLLAFLCLLLMTSLFFFPEMPCFFFLAFSLDFVSATFLGLSHHNIIASAWVHPRVSEVIPPPIPSTYPYPHAGVWVYAMGMEKWTQGTTHEKVLCYNNKY
ncbi:hypothetical protein BU15DRAFT_64632 [Melanogaster broomeanus]|nr:hypothetical protein BU15DRAFT_64632 [Melanogaster broomeanus]